ncbi:MAG: magnesium and cobalt efflux protein CorC [Betaproteobacteria bacterium RIFCSPLOWO2_12_FULL_62_13]|nr:MAG: magnesium and cobalt efflux protein CorC [Betaproteobacteria bacterium RIFCSPLOWO2_12_FULL_62_13]
MEDIPVSTLFAALFFLLIVSAFFSISETSMMALNRYRLKHLTQSGHRGARLASELLANTDKFLGVVLLGNNVINAASALLVGEIARRHLGDSQFALLIATGAAAFAILVFSEITPKVIGAAYPERIALPSSYVLTPLLKLTRPVVWFVNLFVQALLRLMWLNPGSGEHKLSVEELRTLVLEAGYIPRKHQSILINLFDLEAITVDDVMVPRSQIEAIDLDAPLGDVTQQISTAYHRRLLVYTGHLDEVVGTLRVRHVLNLLRRGELTRDSLRAIVREPYFVPAGTPLFSQLQNFQEHQDRVGLVVDEYGELMGLVTLEDILEEIIGEFTTQSPLQTRGFHRQEDGSFLVEGSTLLRELNRKLGFRFPLDGPKTLNGLILEHLQDIPEPNISVKIADYPLEIVQTQDRVVKAVRVFPPAGGAPDATAR